MKVYLSIIMIALLLTFGIASSKDMDVLPAPNGITIPEGYKDWSIIAPSHRSDNNTMRVVLGNDIAMKAAREGKINPWPHGSVLAKIVWKNTTLEKWKTATIPGEFVHSEFMIKDSVKYPATGGWGFARWEGMDLTPYGKDDSFVKECFGCHTPVRDNDYVFTHPAVIP